MTGAMWVETFPHGELINLQSATAITVDGERDDWFVVARMCDGDHRVLVAGLENRDRAARVVSALVSILAQLIPVVRAESQLAHLLPKPNLGAALERTSPAFEVFQPGGTRGLPRVPGGKNGRVTVGGARGKSRDPERMMPAAPLAEAVRTARRPVRELARQAEALTGGNDLSYKRLIERILAGEQESVTIGVADRMALVLDRHPATIWPGDW